MRESNKPTPTGTLISDMNRTDNPVTRSVLADIIGNRIDRALKHSVTTKPVKEK